MRLPLLINRPTNWLGAAGHLYGLNPQMARDEAKGLASGPMIDFDADGVRREFQIPERYMPVMLLPVGYATGGNWKRNALWIGSSVFLGQRPSLASLNQNVAAADAATNGWEVAVQTLRGQVVVLSVQAELKRIMALGRSSLPKPLILPVAAAR